MPEGSGRPRAPLRRRTCQAASLVSSLACALSAGCASGGPPTSAGGPVSVPTRSAFDGVSSDFTNQLSSVEDTVISAQRARTWSALPVVFQALGVATQALDARSFTIGNEQFRATSLEGRRLSAFLQCGSGVTGPNADSYEVTLQLFVQLESRGATGTLVRTLLDAYARPRYGNAPPIHCSSLGTLERRIFALLEERLSAPEGEAAGVIALSPAIGGGPVPGVAGSTRGGFAAARRPAVGDHVRVVCAPFPPRGSSTAEGTYMGTADGGLLLEVGSPARRVTVPAAGLSSVQIRQRRTRGRVGAVVGAVLGAGAGALVGKSSYSPTAKNHYPREVYVVGGAIVGGIGAALLGTLLGSAIRHDTWVQAPLDLVVEHAGAAPTSGVPGSSPGCASLDPPS